ncbi:tail fiber protein [Chromobacterium amazonense]|uniref:Tail fiber protein n=1 Tax=Chromobacterium amazonense TaxID=1382803 RepID=A0ABU8V2I7_9NEIS|nr:tail fiber protein [Chromobacterium amazonense]MDQ4540736.1 tail fiber protein [Chromobacterium amazonense]
MANLPNPTTPNWVDVYQIETTDRVLGGPDGIANRQAKQLVERCAFLKKKLDDMVSGALTAEYANRLKTPRTLSLTGDGAWSVSFDGRANATAAMALAATGIKAGEYQVITVDAKGRATAGRALKDTDIPELPWGKITSGKPTTLTGYGIGDAYTKTEIDSRLDGKETVAHNSATFSPTAGGWYRLATSVKGIQRNSGEFMIKWTVGGVHGSARLTAGCHFGLESGSSIQQLEYSCYGANGINEARLVFHPTYADNYAYLEVKFVGALTNVKLNTSGRDLLGWSLLAPNTAGGVPEGYKTYVHTFIAPGSIAAGRYTRVTTNQEGRVISGDNPNTLAGVGINDAYTKAETDGKLGGKADKTTSLSGYGITDAYTKAETDGKLGRKADKTNTLAGYGIGDAYTKTEVDRILNGKPNKATTLAGYGIADTYTKTETDSKLNSKPNKANTLAGYGIGDAYTKTETDSKLNGKQNKATTLAGYGITDAMPIRATAITNQDWNTLVTEGFYDVVQASGPGRPPAYDFGVLLVARGKGSAFSQLYMAHGGSEVWCRGGWEGANWHPWKRLDANDWADIRNKPAGLRAIPAGQMVVTFSETPPEGTLVCNGAAVSRTAYAALFSMIGTKYGAGNGSTTFNLPNIPDGFALLAANGSAVGSTTAGDIRSHAHGANAWTDTQGEHVHGMDLNTKGGNSNPAAAGVSSGYDWTGYNASPMRAAGGHGHNVGVTVQAAGGSHNYAAGMRLLVCITY